jgi:CheY-like chemotaxis protein
MMPKLLLADDSITVQRVIALTYLGEGIDLIAVGDGDQAVAAIDRERPQIVLADLSMPGRDGYAVAEYVKRSPEHARATRVVLLTGAAEPVEEARSRALGIDGVLSKPFEPHVATALVRRLLTESPTVPGFQGVVPAGNGAEAAVPASAPVAGGSVAPDAIAVDDYFRRLDEALATAGLAPEAPADLAGMAAAAAQAPADRSQDAETLVVPRVAAPVEPAPEPESDGSPKLVDAFSALLAAEEGDGAVVAGPLEVSEPDPVPAVEWTPGGAARAGAPSPAAVASDDAVTGDAATVMLAAVPPPPVPAAAPEPPASATAPADAHAETVVLAAVKPIALVEPPAAPAAEAPADVAQAADAVAATGGAAEPVDAPTLHLPTPSPAPAALRKDVADHAALEGIDLDVFADAVAQKILHRLTDARIDAIVSERVLEIAERLVREEIERIKADAQ